MSNDKEPAKTYSLPRQWKSPAVQKLFGEALTQTGRKYKDADMIRQGWGHQQVARRNLADRNPDQQG